MTSIILVTTTITTALITGLFYAYSCSVSIGLGRLPDKEYLSAMQSINRAILNPLFFLSFMGSLLLLPLSAFLHYHHSTPFVILLVASIVYIAGSFGVTIFGNVPLNKMLDQFDLSAASPDLLARQRQQFEISWNKFHTVRTIACVVSLVLVVIAGTKCVVQ